MRKCIALSMLCFALIVPLAACGTGNDGSGGDSQATDRATVDLPDAVPAGLPLPADADPDVTTRDLSGAKQVVVSFTTAKDAASVYGSFRQYAEDNGYVIATENQDNHRFASNSQSGDGLTVSVSDMGSVKVATVTFVILAN